MNLEKTEIWITTEKPLELSDGRAIRGGSGIFTEIGRSFLGTRRISNAFRDKGHWRIGKSDGVCS